MTIYAYQALLNEDSTPYLALVKFLKQFRDQPGNIQHTLYLLRAVLLFPSHKLNGLDPVVFISVKVFLRMLSFALDDVVFHAVGEGLLADPNVFPV